MAVLFCGPLPRFPLYRSLFFLLVSSVLLYFVPLVRLLSVSVTYYLFNPGAAENAVAVVEDGALAWSYGALWRFENNSRAGII